MRRLPSLALLIIATLAAGRLFGQGDKPVLTVAGAPGADVELVRNHTAESLGRTNASGQLSYDPSLLSGKPMIDLHVTQCPKNTTNKVTLSLFPRAADGKPEAHPCPPGCDCPCKKAAFAWSDSFSTSIPGPSGFFSTGNPAMWALIGGAAGGGVLLATAGNSSGTTTNPPPPATTLTFDKLYGPWTTTAMVQTQSNCQPTNFSTTVTVGGTSQQTTATITQVLANRNQTLNFTGATTLQGGVLVATLASNGSLISLGAFTASLTMQTNTTGSAWTGTEHITTNACPFDFSMSGVR